RGPRYICARLPCRACRSRRGKAAIRGRTRRCRCATDADHSDGGRPDRRGRPDDDPGAFYPLCQFSRSLRSGIAERLYGERAADFAADRLPRLSRSDSLAHWLGLPAGERLARAPAARCLLKALNAQPEAAAGEVEDVAGAGVGEGVADFVGGTLIDPHLDILDVMAERLVIRGRADRLGAGNDN